MIKALTFGKRDGEDVPRVRRPEHCDPTCIHFHTCSFPKSCPTLEKDRRETERLKREPR